MSRPLQTVNDGAPDFLPEASSLLLVAQELDLGPDPPTSLSV
jgi:hypothetical protein